MNNLHLVHKVIHRYLGKGVSKETLYSIGCIALINAVDRYDPNAGAQFSTYAYAIISGEIKHHFRDQVWDVSVPRSLKEDYVKVNRELDQLTQKLGHSPTVSEIAAHVGLTEERIVEALEVGKDYHSLSLDAPRSDGDSNTSQFQIAGEDLSSEDFIESMDLKNAISELPKREQLIVELSFFHEMTQQEIAERLGISQIHVSRLLRQATEKLKKVTVK